MSENEKKKLAEHQKADSSKKLSDEDLEGATGGAFGITILDTCEKRWNKGICWGAIWGVCPNLETISSKTTQFEYTDEYRCKKGYFSHAVVIRPSAVSTES